MSCWKKYFRPHYKLVEKYRKPNGYIGIGMHSWDKFKETPLQDGEAAARLLSNYGIPKDSAIIKDFIVAMRDDAVLQEEFSYLSRYSFSLRRSSSRSS